MRLRFSISFVQEGLPPSLHELVFPVLEGGRRYVVFARQFGGRYAGADKFHYDSCLVLRGASLTRTLPLTSCPKKHTDLIGLILEGSAPSCNCLIGRTISRGIVSQESFHRNYFHRNRFTGTTFTGIVSQELLSQELLSQEQPHLETSKNYPKYRVNISKKKPSQTPDTGQPIHHFIVQTLPFPHPKVSAYLTLQDTLTNPQNHLLKTLSHQPSKQACKPTGLLHLRKHRPTAHLIHQPSKPPHQNTGLPLISSISHQKTTKHWVVKNHSAANQPSKPIPSKIFSANLTIKNPSD